MLATAVLGGGGEALGRRPETGASAAWHKIQATPLAESFTATEQEPLGTITRGALQQAARAHPHAVAEDELGGLQLWQLGARHDVPRRRQLRDQLRRRVLQGVWRV